MKRKEQRNDKVCCSLLVLIIVAPVCDIHSIFCSVILLFCFHLIGYYVFNALRFGAGIVLTVTFEQIDSTPDTERGSERDDEGLKSTDGRVEEFHIFTFFS